MKKIQLVIVFLLIGYYAFAQNNYIIEGQMLKDSLRFTKGKIEKLYLVTQEEGKTIKIDSALVHNGHFRFEGKAPNILKMCAISGFDNGFISVFLEPGTIKVQPFDAHFPVGAKVCGTPNNDLLYRYQVLQDSVTKRARNNKIQEGTQEEFNAEFFKNSMLNKTEVMKFIANNLQYQGVLYIIKHDISPMVTTKVLERQFLRALPKDVKQHPLYEEMVNDIKSRNLKVGALAPDIVGFTLDGEELKLSSLQGKYVLLDFWASWCGPCKREIPFIKQVLKNAKGTDKLVVLSYSIDDKKQDWVNAINKLGLKDNNWIHISTLKGWESAAVKLYGVKGIPYMVLINPQGYVVYMDLRGEEMVKKLSAILSGEEDYE